jgi:hypothetical protein
MVNLACAPEPRSTQQCTHYGYCNLYACRMCSVPAAGHVRRWWGAVREVHRLDESSRALHPTIRLPSSYQGPSHHHSSDTASGASAPDCSCLCVAQPDEDVDKVVVAPRSGQSDVRGSFEMFMSCHVISFYVDIGLARSACSCSQSVARLPGGTGITRQSENAQSTRTI